MIFKTVDIHIYVKVWHEAQCPKKNTKTSNTVVIEANRVEEANNKF